MGLINAFFKLVCSVICVFRQSDCFYTAGATEPPEIDPLCSGRLLRRQALPLAYSAVESNILLENPSLDCRINVEQMLLCQYGLCYKTTMPGSLAVSLNRYLPEVLRSPT